MNLMDEAMPDMEDLAFYTMEIFDTKKVTVTKEETGQRITIHTDAGLDKSRMDAMNELGCRLVSCMTGDGGLDIVFYNGLTAEKIMAMASKHLGPGYVSCYNDEEDKYVIDYTSVTVEDTAVSADAIKNFEEESKLRFSEIIPKKGKRFKLVFMK